MYHFSPDVYPFFILVVSQHYGLGGGDQRKIDTKSIVLDLEIWQQICKEPVISDIKKKLEDFVKKLQSAKETGRRCFFVALNMLRFCSSNLILSIDHMTNTTRNYATSNVFAVIKTKDSSIRLILTFEVKKIINKNI